MSRLTKYTILIAIIAAVMGLSACEQLVQLLSDGDSAAMDTRMPQLTGVSGEIPIGLVSPLTGRFNSSYGPPLNQGFELGARRD